MLTLAELEARATWLYRCPVCNSQATFQCRIIKGNRFHTPSRQHPHPERTELARLQCFLDECEEPVTSLLSVAGKAELIACSSHPGKRPPGSLSSAITAAWLREHARRREAQQTPSVTAPQLAMLKAIQALSSGPEMVTGREIGDYLHTTPAAVARTAESLFAKRMVLRFQPRLIDPLKLALTQLGRDALAAAGEPQNA